MDNLKYPHKKGKTAIIFGCSGQDGIFLKKLLIEKKIHVIGVSRSSGEIKGDVSNYELVEEIVKKYKPFYIFHFAAISTTKHFAIFDNHNSICTGTLNILEAVKIHNPKTKVFLSGSAMQFKNNGKPIDENSEFEASSSYSVSRIQSVYAARYYRKFFNLKVYIGYFFNHDSEYRNEMHVNQKVVKTVKEIASGKKIKLKLGNIDIKKEFSYADDIVEAVWILINQDQIFEAVIGSGIAYSLKDWVKICFDKIGKQWEDFVVIEIGFKPEYEILVSNPKLIKSLNWKPKVSFSELADIMFSN